MVEWLQSYELYHRYNNRVSILAHTLRSDGEGKRLLEKSHWQDSWEVREKIPFNILSYSHWFFFAFNLNRSPIKNFKHRFWVMLTPHIINCAVVFKLAQGVEYIIFWSCEALSHPSCRTWVLFPPNGAFSIIGPTMIPTVLHRLCLCIISGRLFFLVCQLDICNNNTTSI